MQDKNNLSFAEHLQELRRRFLITLAVFVVLMIVFYIKSDVLLNWLLTMGQDTGYNMVYTAPQEILVQQLKVSATLAFICSLPVAMFEVCTFFYPAFDQTKYIRIKMLFGCLASGGLFLCGMYFAYRALLPFLYRTLYDLGTTVMATPMVSVDSYITLYTTFLIWIGIIFEFPMAVALLSWFGLMTPSILLKGLKPAIVVIFIIAALLTPPDVVTQCILALPMIGLYGLSMALCAGITKSRTRREAAA